MLITAFISVVLMTISIDENVLICNFVIQCSVDSDSKKFKQTVDRLI